LLIFDRANAKNAQMLADKPNRGTHLGADCPRLDSRVTEMLTSRA